MLPASGLCQTSNRVYFIYQQYEFMACVYGTPEFLIPCDKVKPYLTKEALTLINFPKKK